MNRLSFCFLLLTALLLPQKITTPLEESNFKKLTSHAQVLDFIGKLPKTKAPFVTETIAVSAKGREIPILKFSLKEFGTDPAKLKVLLFAQQHGDEPSGKEGALMLIRDLVSGDLSPLLEKLDIAIVPMMNPDGNEGNRRRNGNGADLNRDHLLLLQPENQGLHNFYNRYNFDVSMDVHEYSPYSESWMETGYIKNSDVTAGRLTNINTPEALRNFSENEYLPFLAKYVRSAGFSYAEYTPGGPPEKEYIRHSTYDINDGRQGFGSLGTLSFIQEGKNGIDSVENIKTRSNSQKTGMTAYLKFMFENAGKIKEMVEVEKKKIVDGSPEKVAIQMIHTGNGKKLEMHLLTLATGKDTVVFVNDYRPVVKSVFDVVKPAGYLIPADDKELVNWANRHKFIMTKYSPDKSDRIEEYMITKIDSMDFEGDIVINPGYSTATLTSKELKGDYYLLTTRQLGGNVVVQALEPKSIIGLATYKYFDYLIKAGTKYPVLRLVK
ncbi:MAG: succinylglutamate desuccinylase/aspartoacylase family protein [Ignavibacteria bacterium]|nr:succinylglutamate desuccinylase/aspartoacylase family protein [Ignavibacteria bacterium]